MPNYEENRPITCYFCGNTVNGRLSEDECRWVCDRCGQLVRVDNIEPVQPEQTESK